MSDMEHTQIGPSGQATECITIVARDSAAATKEFHKRGLQKAGYSIASKVVRHTFAFIDENGINQSLFGGETVYAATYSRAI